MIYLDNAATTPVDPEVANVIHEALLENYYNPSSVYQAGKKNKHLINQARQQIKELIHLPKADLYFTSGATEANNWAILSQAMKAKALGYGHHIVATAIEHPSVLEVLKYLETQGFDITYLKPHALNFSVEQFIAATTPQTMGWVAMLVNNELGARLPIEVLGKIAKDHVKWFHVDAVQAFGHGKVDLEALNATSYSASGHKLGAPKGIGFLAYQPWDEKMTLQPLLYGGGQEAGLRSGTENLPYILGLTKAFELSNQANLDNVSELANYLMNQLNQKDIKFERNGAHQVPYIVNLYFPNIDASQLLVQTDLANIAISAGSACSAGSLEVSHVLSAYYPNDDQRHHQSIRLSFGKQNTKEEIDTFIQQLINLKERTKQLWHSQQPQH